ncbi:hypothetical protein [Ruegeria conchae]|uniref:hypothetical protein n=1 Tax=Ruegeria conchae TaxID=981384 RepID=UPI00031CD52F|nr:hypothetical protein [Ruegeria conchae]
MSFSEASASDSLTQFGFLWTRDREASIEYKQLQGGIRTQQFIVSMDDGYGPFG